MSAADGAIAAAGWGATHDLASVGTPTALVAEHRPFDEQSVRLDALSANGVVHRLDHWPTPPEVPSILGQLDQLPADPWNGRYDRCGAQRAAHIIEGVHRG
jgi:predicted glycosyltransferase